LQHHQVVVEVVQVTITEVKLVTQEVLVVDRHFMLPQVLNLELLMQVDMIHPKEILVAVALVVLVTQEAAAVALEV